MNGSHQRFEGSKRRRLEMKREVEMYPGKRLRRMGVLSINDGGLFLFGGD